MQNADLAPLTIRCIGEVERTEWVAEGAKTETNTVNERCIVSTRAKSVKVKPWHHAHGYVRARSSIYIYIYIYMYIYLYIYIII